MSEDIRPFEVQNYNPSVHELADDNYTQPSIVRRTIAVGLVTLACHGAYNYSSEFDNTPDTEIEANSEFSMAVNALLDEISVGEGGYNSANTGDAGDTEVGGEKYNEIFDGRKLTELTIQEVLDLQASGTIFATGRWQMVDGTLGGAVKNSGIDPRRMYDEIAQRELATYLILGGIKRPTLTKFLTGGDVSAEAALEDLCAEWAGVPCNDGYGRYDEDKAGNMAHGGLERAGRLKMMMISVREKYLRSQEMQTPQTPKITMIGDSLSVGYEKLAGIALLDEAHNLEISHIDARESRPLVGGDFSGLQAIEENQSAIAGSDITVIGLGTNAVETDDQYRDGVDHAITRIHELTKANPNAKIAFVENYSYEDGSKSGNRRERRNQILDEVIDRYDDVFLIHIDRDKLEYAEGNVHLTQHGYGAASEQILSQLELIVQR